MEFKSCSNAVSRVSQGCLKRAPRVFKRCLKVFKMCLKGFKGVSWVFLGCLKGVSSVFRLF